jgi:mono/diheme cytochrome c family protein
MAGRRTKVLCAALLLALGATALHAGGWVVITVADAPDSLAANQPFTFTYAVRQHGMRLLSGLTGRIEARSSNGRVITAPAVPTRDAGYYSAILTFPQADTWKVAVISGFGGQLDRSHLEIAVLDDPRMAPALSAVERGQRLYVSKGCITCHAHAAIDGRSTVAGPRLTHKRYDPDRLRQLLIAPPRREPVEAPNWQMPNLGLRDAEVEALMAFLTAGTS